MRFLYKIKRLSKEIKWKIQRARRGFSDYDTWSIDIWFINTMKPMLEYFKDNLHGVPIYFDGDEEKWVGVLKRMIFLLDEMDRDKCSFKNRYKKEYEEYLTHWSIEKTEEEQKLLRLFLGEEENKYRYMELCKEEFFNLFSKFFYDLWD